MHVSLVIMAVVLVYLLFIQLGERRAIAGIGGNKHQQKQQNKYAKTGEQTRAQLYKKLSRKLW